MFTDLAAVLTALEYRTVFPVVHIKSFVGELLVVFTAEYTHATHSTTQSSTTTKSSLATSQSRGVVTHQGVYKFNQTNFQEIPGGISREIQDMFALLRLAM